MITSMGNTLEMPCGRASVDRICRYIMSITAHSLIYKTLTSLPQASLQHLLLLHAATQQRLKISCGMQQIP